MTGEVVGRHVHVGNVAFADAAGRIAYDDGHITTKAHASATTQRRHLYGDGPGGPRREPVMDLSVDVMDESLADLLAMAGLRRPSPSRRARWTHLCAAGHGGRSRGAHSPRGAGSVGRRSPGGVRSRAAHQRRSHRSGTFGRGATVDGPHDDTARLTNGRSARAKSPMKEVSARRDKATASRTRDIGTKMF